jgi:hypothetical protein
MRQDLNAKLDQYTAWLDISRQSSAAKGNMGGSPPVSMQRLKPAPDD